MFGEKVEQWLRAGEYLLAAREILELSLKEFQPTKGRQRLTLNTLLDIIKKKGEVYLSVKFAEVAVSREWRTRVKAQEETKTLLTFMKEILAEGAKHARSSKPVKRKRGRDCSSGAVGKGQNSSFKKPSSREDLNSDM